MPEVLRIVLAILTLLTALAMLGLTVFALTIPHLGLFVVCLLLTAGIGYFSYRDYLRFFGKKDNNDQTKQV